MIEEDFFRETDTKPIFDAEEHGKVSLFVYELNRSFGTIVGRGSVLQTVNDEVLETIRDEINRGETVVAVKVPVCVQQLVPEGKSLCRNPPAAGVRWVDGAGPRSDVPHFYRHARRDEEYYDERDEVDRSLD